MRWRLLLLAVVLTAAGCSGGGAGHSTTTTEAVAHRRITVVLWVDGSPALRSAYAAAAARFHAASPWVTVRVQAQPVAPTLLEAVTAGNPPDAVAAALGGELAPYCASGVLLDLHDLATAAGLGSHVFAGSTSSFTGYGGLTCALPALTRAYGLIADADALSAADISRLPRSWQQLSADAVQMTLHDPAGGIVQAGFIPWQGYEGFDIGTVALSLGGHWFDSSGHADLAGQQAWTQALMWQRRLLQQLGPAAVAGFIGAPGDALAEGRLAMVLGSAAAIPAGAPAGRYLYWATPSDNGYPYGAGRVGGQVLAIPRGAAHQGETFALLEYLASDPPTQRALAAAAGGGALPGSRTALASLRTGATPSLLTQINQVTQARSAFAPELSLDGSAYAQLIAAFDRRWQRGLIPSSQLNAALTRLDRRIDQRLSLVTQQP